MYRLVNAKQVQSFQYWRIADYSDVVLLDALRDDILRANPEGVRAILKELGKRHAN
ncbi:hypothetical protein [Dyella sp.]|jgi:hypothetical protein|uniref:hypothetical protein n=1 Tax=Dyella sp. TaxID=1869338 RepID=UPI002FD9B00F